MLRELFHFFVTPCPKTYRRLDYLSGLIAIQGRYKRVADHWRTHLDNSRQLILHAAAQTPQRNKVVVIGSGLLLDVPVEMLAKQFNTVILIDIAHLISVRLLCMRHSNITLVEHDITGLAEALLSYRRGESLPRPQAGLPAVAQNADLIISCNILSQLAITPAQYLQQHFVVDGERLANWRQEIIFNHLALLTEQPGQRVLLCDVFHDYLDRNDNLLYREDVLHGIKIGDPEQQWRWSIAPEGELDASYRLQATVSGFSNWSWP